MELEIITSPSKILETQSSKKIFTKIIKGILKFLEKYFGSEILVKIPLGLYDFDNNLLKAINVCHKLQSLGIIKNITKRPNYPDEPFLYNYYTSSAGRAYGSGVDFFNKEKAIWRALAEAVERYLWQNSDDFYKNRLLKTSYKDVKNNALNIFSLAGFSQEQKKQNLFFAI